MQISKFSVLIIKTKLAHVVEKNEKSPDKN